MNQAASGAAAISSGDFASAINHYTEAIAFNATAVKYYIERSKAYTRISPPNYPSSLRDAETAVTLAFNRQTKELILNSQFRRAVALFGLERYADARQCLEWVDVKLSVDEKKSTELGKMVPIWEMKANSKLKGLKDGDAKLEVSVQENPKTEVPKPTTFSKPVEQNDTSNGVSANAKPPNPISNSSASSSALRDPSKIRWEWYQNSENVTISIYAKGIPKEKAHVEIKPLSLEVSFPLASGSEYCLSLEPLFDTIDEKKSSYKIMSTKAEFTLIKSAPNQMWATVEKVDSFASGETNVDSKDSHDAVKRAAFSPTSTNTGPAYPTSSKSGPKNWDKVAEDLSKRPKKEKKEGDESAEEDVGLDDEEGDPTTNFFKKLYAGADANTRRAMMKSYSESNGTALSTNWAEVQKGPVETSPPEGMEAKKWGG